MAKGNLHAHSDVDLMIVGSVGFADVVLALAPAQDALRREINPSVLGRHEFIKRRDQQDSFVAAIWKEPKLWLLGSADERSEEHTSELQSLMRISYAVFCLTK